MDKIQTETRFDDLTRSLAAGASRRSVLKGAAGGIAALVAGTAWRTNSVSAATAGGVVYQYYQALAARDYHTAYSYLGGGLAQSHPYDQWVQGYADTAYVDLKVTKTTPIPEKNQFKYAVTLTAWHTDGGIVLFKGSYTEGREGGTPKIIDATLTQSSASGVAPLCNAKDLTATETGDAGAGQRYGTVTVVNNGATCVMGALPGVQIYSPHHHKLIAGTLEQGSVITTVKLATGDKAKLDMHWSNWCGAKINGEVTTTVHLPAGQGTWSGLKGIGAPPCLGDPGSASTLTFKPWAKA
jgi:hypothetical protein